MRRSTKAPTKAQSQRMDALSRTPCVACDMLGYYSRSEIHHLNLGGHAGQKRLGHDYTIPLCPWHHRGVRAEGFPTDKVCEALLGPSLAKSPRLFRDRFGKDEALLALVNARLADV